MTIKQGTPDVEEREEKIVLVEVRHALKLLRDFLCRGGKITQEILEEFCDKLEQLLVAKYQNHWHPDRPQQGSAYRCLRIAYSTMDPMIASAAIASGVSEEDLLRTLPAELTIWIDPNEVSYRIGEDGSICELFKCSKEDKTQDVKKTKMASLANVSCRMESQGHDCFDKMTDNLQKCVPS